MMNNPMIQVCVCIYLRMYTHVCVGMMNNPMIVYIFTYIYTCVYWYDEQPYDCIYLRIYTHVCVCMHVLLFICIYSCIYIYITDGWYDEQPYFFHFFFIFVGALKSNDE
jgi:hypothetical protein